MKHNISTNDNDRIIAKCDRCGSPLAGNFCSDETCPFSDHPQDSKEGWAGHPDPPALTLNSHGTTPAEVTDATPSLRDALDELLAFFATYEKDYGETIPAFEKARTALAATKNETGNPVGGFAILEISGGIVSLAKDSDISRVIVRDYDVEDEEDTETDPETGKPFWEYSPD
jgi:hypothetical protein